MEESYGCRRVVLDKTNAHSSKLDDLLECLLIIICEYSVSKLNVFLFDHGMPVTRSIPLRMLQLGAFEFVSN